jgi:hypothetical protein
VNFSSRRAWQKRERELFDDSCRVSATHGIAPAQPLVTVDDMRIELPLPSWAETMPRADDDAHTLTMAPSPMEWTPWQWGSDPAPTLRTQVDAMPVVPVTLTL